MLAAGTVIAGRYEIQEKIGTGGMAYVYRAKDIKLERNVTLKVLKEEYSNDENFKSRFGIEARSAAKLSHPNIVNAYDFGEENGICYICGNKCDYNDKVEINGTIISGNRNSQYLLPVLPTSPTKL